MIWNRNKSSLSIIDLYVTLQKKNNLIAYILSLAMDVSTKQRRTEEVDFKKCIICQTDTTEALVKNISIDAYKNILFYVCSRGKYGETEFAEASKRLEGVSEHDLKHSSATFHASCRKATVSSEKLKRAQTRFEKAVASNDVAVLSRAPGRPSLESKSCLPLEINENPSVPQRLSRTLTIGNFMAC